MPPRPPLALNVEVATANGARYLWDSAAADPRDRPQSLSFRTKRGDGFADASMTLSRRIDLDFTDQNLLDELAFIGADGSVAWEGRTAAMPRSMGTEHSVTIQGGGWMGHAKDRKFTEIYVDRDLNRWIPASVTERTNRATANVFAVRDSTVQPDTVSPALAQEVADEAWTVNGEPLVEGWYDAGAGLAIGSIYYAGKRNAAATSATWTMDVILSLDDVGSSIDSTANLNAATWAGTLFPTTATRRYAAVRFWFPAANATATNKVYGAYWTCLAVYGTHGLTKQGAGSATSAPGLYVSDVIANIASRFCPKLDTSGVLLNPYVVPHCVFATRTTPYDALLELNKYTLWNLGVWENKRLVYEPVDLTEPADWQVRTSDPNVTVSLQGDSTEDMANGIVVEFTDLATMKSNVLTPDTNPALKITNPSNPANTHGYPVWTELTLSSPTTAASAEALGVAALYEFNLPKQVGTIGITGHVRDAAGHYQQVWKMRAGDTIAITDYPNSVPRMIVETDYNHTSKEISLSVDSTFRQLDAVLDRITTALSASGLS